MLIGFAEAHARESAALLSVEALAFQRIATKEKIGTRRLRSRGPTRERTSERAPAPLQLLSEVDRTRTH